jgi:glycosyltransferase involved in cell wall biosynthesis
VDKVSIIMPTYNRAHCISDAIKSVLKQTHQDWELIICDDCSTDNTKEVVERFSDNRIHYHKNNINFGLPANRNYGIHLSKYPLVLFWEDDVVMDEYCLEILFNSYRALEFQDIKVGAISPRAIAESKKGGLITLETLVANDVRKKMNKPSCISKWTGLIFENLTLEYNGIIQTDVVCPWSLFNKDAILSVGGYSDWYGRLVGYSHEETDLFVRLVKHGYGLYYQSSAVSYHNHSKTGGTRVSIVRYSWNYLSSHMIFLVKNFGWKSVYMMPLCFGYLFLNAMRYLPKLVLNV